MQAVDKMKARGIIPKAAVYARFSSDNQRDESIDAQLRAIQKYCEQSWTAWGIRPMRVKAVIKSRFLRPKVRPYKTENVYEYAEKQYDLEKEVKAIINEDR